MDWTSRWRRWLRSSDGTDAELVRGVVGLVLVAATVATALCALWWWWDGQPLLRIAAPLALAIATFGLVSHDWSRRSLRIAGALVAILLLLVAVDIGKDEFSDAVAEDAGSEAVDVDADVDALAPQLEAAEDAIEAERAATLAALRTAINSTNNADGELKAAADDVADAVEPKVPGFRAELALFDAIYRPAGASTAAARLREAVDEAIAAAEADPPDPEPVTTAVAEVKALTTAADPDAAAVEVAVATMRLRLAQYRAAVLERPEEDALVEQRTGELTDAIADGEEDPTVVASLRRGGEAVVADLPTQDADVPIVLEGLAWALLAAAAIAGWRLVEARSGRATAGPVVIEPLAGSGSDEKASAHDPVFRQAILRNIPDPGTTPGSEAAGSLTDLVGEALGGATAGKVMSFLKSVLTRSHGYKVTGEVVEIPAAAGTPVGGSTPATAAATAAASRWQVLVRVADGASGEQVAISRQSGSTATEACRAAGYWAAAAILERSRRIPSWAKWEPATANALAVYDSIEDASATMVREAVAKAPTSGVLLQHLGGKYDLEGRYRDALSVYARAVAVHPRYAVAAYRLAGSLWLMAGDADRWAAPRSERQRVCDQLRRALERLGVDTDGLDRLLADDDHRGQFRELSCAVLVHLRRRTWPWWVLLRCFRVTERVQWWPYLRRSGSAGGPARRQRQLARAAELIVRDAIDRAGPGGHPPAKDTSKLYRRTRRASEDPRSWWQVSYNLACYHARRGQPAAALTLLETALERPGSRMLARDWMERDPDLADVRHTPRFRHVADFTSREGDRRDG